MCRVLQQGRLDPNQRGVTTVQAQSGRVLTFNRDLDQIIARVQQRCGDRGLTGRAAQAAAAVALEIGEPVKLEDAIGTMEEAQKALQDDNVLWVSVLEWLAVLVTFLSGVAAALRFVPIPPLRLVASGANFMLKRVAGFQGAIIARRAANDVRWFQLANTVARLKKAA